MYDVGLPQCEANHTPLTPLSLLLRAADVYPNYLSVIHGARRFTWRETYERSCQLASALARRGIKRGDTVAAILANTPEMYEAHFGVPMSGAVLNAINTRLEPDGIAFILRHGEAKVLLVDGEFSATVSAALAQLERRPLVIDVRDPEYRGAGDALGELDYEQLSTLR